MTLPASGAISMSQVNAELARASNASTNLNEAVVRALAGKRSGAISMNDLHGKNGLRFDGNLTMSGGPLVGTNDPSAAWYGGLFAGMVQQSPAQGGLLTVAFDSAPNWSGNVTVTNNTTGASAVCTKANSTTWQLAAANTNIVYSRAGFTDSFSVTPS
jgi:hypothetical protein